LKDLKNLLATLKLAGIKESIDYRLMESAKANLGYEDFTRLLLEDEILFRTNKKSSSLRQRATFKDSVLLSDFDYDPKRGISKILLKEFQSLHFMKGFENIYFIGGTGAGKSFLAQAIGHHACLAGIDAKFISMNYLFEQYKASEKAGQVLSFFKKFSNYRLLILDDIGLRKFTHEEATVLYQIVEDRYKKQSTIITTQIRSLGLKDLFDDQVIAEAVIDRLVSNAHIIEVKGQSYRKKQIPKEKMAVENGI
jgi:DNA replication protein DnaC